MYPNFNSETRIILFRISSTPRYPTTGAFCHVLVIALETGGRSIHVLSCCSKRKAKSVDGLAEYSEGDWRKSSRKAVLIAMG